MITVTQFDDISAEEIRVETQGYSFLCIVGEHINGGFIAIVNWGVSAEISSDVNEVRYNANNIYNALHKCGELSDDICEVVADDIAVALKES